MFKKKILEEFPAANDLAYQRMFAGRTIFFDTKTHKPLYQKNLIKAALYLAIRWAHRAGLKLSLSKDEEKLLKTLFEILPGLLLLTDFFNYWQ